MANLKPSKSETIIPNPPVNSASTEDEFKNGIETSSPDKRSTPDLHSNKIEELFNLTVTEHRDKPTALLNPNLISRRLARSPSIRSTSQTSIVSKLSKHGKNVKERKHPLKRSSSKASSRSMKSTSSMNEIFEENVTIINENEETNLSIVESKKDESIEENIEVDYEMLCPQNKCGDLINMKFANNQEKYLVVRIYSKVNNLSTILSQMDHINLQHYLNTPDENECLPIYYAIKSDCMSTVKLLVEKGSTLKKTTTIGDPAPHLACLLGVSIELLDYLLSFDKDNVNLYNTDQEGWTILHCACNQGTFMKI
jgi:ankyrin repeat protein